MVILKLKNVNNNIEEMINEYENMLNIWGFKCPKCECEGFNYYGSYYRNVIYIDNNGEHKETIIKIKRIQCNQCGMTHSVIPDFIVPYKQHAVYVINTALKEKINKEKTNKEIGEKYKVSRQLRRKWELSFMKYISKLYTFYDCRNISELIINVFKDKNIINNFYNKFREIYLLKREYAIYGYIPT